MTMSEGSARTRRERSESFPCKRNSSSPSRTRVAPRTSALTLAVPLEPAGDVGGIEADESSDSDDGDEMFGDARRMCRTLVSCWTSCGDVDE